LWKPLNGHGLVAANPVDAAEQTYSYLVLPDGKVTSYLNILWGFCSRPEYADRDFFSTRGPMFQLASGGDTVVIADTNASSGRFEIR
jgi:levansucrase